MILLHVTFSKPLETVKDSIWNVTLLSAACLKTNQNLFTMHEKDY